MRSRRGSEHSYHLCPECGDRINRSSYFQKYQCLLRDCRYTRPVDKVDTDETVEQILEAVIYILKNLETTEEQTKHLETLENIWNKLGSDWK